MTWLARASLDYETVAQLRIRDCYDWHQRAWEMFPGRPKGHLRPFLFRALEKDEGCDLWLMCREEPTRPDWVVGNTWKVSSIGENFPFHSRYRFDLLANPTRRDESRDRWQGRERVRGKHRRFNLTETSEQRDWLLRKANEHGFALVRREVEDEKGNIREDSTLELEPRRDFRFTRKDHSHGLHIGVHYRGYLEVTDRQKFAETFKQGIGAAKSFGFGLLLLTPLI